MTATGSVLGSPGWMAPEQLRGTRTDGRVDVFAWGAVVAFAATGRPPFGTGSPSAIAYRVVHEPPDLDGMQPALRRIVEQALSKDPSERPPVTAILAALTGAGRDQDTRVAARTAIADTWPLYAPNGPTALGGSPPLPSATSRPVRRRAAIAALVVAAAAAVVTSVGMVATDDPAPGPAQAPSSATSSPAKSPSSAAQTTAGTPSAPTTGGASAPGSPRADEEQASSAAAASFDFANYTYELDCVGVTATFNLVSGEDRSQFEAIGRFAALHSVTAVDVDADGVDEAAVVLNCVSGASANSQHLLLYDFGPDGPYRVGQPITGLVHTVVGSDATVYNPHYGPDEPYCCPSAYRRTVWRFDPQATPPDFHAAAETIVPVEEVPF